MVSGSDAASLRRESVRLLAGEPLPEPAPVQPQGRVVVGDERLLSSEDWDVIDHEPPHRREVTRRSILEARRQEAARPRQAGPGAPSALPAGAMSLKAFIVALLPQVARAIADVRGEGAARAAGIEARIATLEARIAELEGRDEPR